MFKLSQYSTKERSYILYDVANSAFILTIVTVLFPLYYQTVAAGVENRTQVFAFVTSAIALTIAVMSPVVGALANYKGNKRRFFFIFFIIGLVGGFGLIIPGLSWVTLLAIFVIAEFGYGMSNVIYDAFLVDVTTEDRMDLISSAGYGWGYIGSMIPFMIGIIPYALVTLGFIDSSYEYISIVFAFTLALSWWGFYTIPLLKNVHQTYEAPASKKPVLDALKSIGQTIKEVRQYKYIVIFMIAYLLYIDVVNTVIRLATTLGTELGVGVTTLLGVVILVQLIGFPSAIIYGKFAKKYGGKTMIYFGIAVYVVTIFLTFLINEDRTYLMWVIGGLVGTAQGGIQSISRSYFARMLPMEKANEFFGFFSVFGKFAGILSPFLIGLVITTMGPNFAVIILLGPLSLGALLLFFVKPEKQEALLDQ
jgi:MFS transporter, UMF1 family